MLAFLQPVAELIASQLPDVRMKTVVSKIRWGPEGAEVICKDGQQFYANAVIVTVSLGVLKVSPDLSVCTNLL